MKGVLSYPHAANAAMESEMNIDDLTIGQAKQLAAMFATAGADNAAFTPHIGRRCIVRTYASGVFFATIVMQAGRSWHS